MSIISKISYKIEYDKATIAWIVICNREQNFKMNDYVIKILSNILFDNKIEIIDFFKSMVIKNFENIVCIKILQK